MLMSIIFKYLAYHKDPESWKSMPTFSGPRVKTLAFDFTLLTIALAMNLNKLKRACF